MQQHSYCASMLLVGRPAMPCDGAGGYDPPHHHHHHRTVQRCVWDPGPEFCLRGGGGEGGGGGGLCGGPLPRRPCVSVRPFASHRTGDNKTDCNSPVPVNQQMPCFIADWGCQAFCENPISHLHPRFVVPSLTVIATRRPNHIRCVGGGGGGGAVARGHGVGLLG